MYFRRQTAKSSEIFDGKQLSFKNKKPSFFRWISLLIPLNFSTPKKFYSAIYFEDF